MFRGDLATERNLSEGQRVPPAEKNNTGKNSGKAYRSIVCTLTFFPSKGAWNSSQIFCWNYIKVLFLCFCHEKKYSDHSAFLGNQSIWTR